MLLQHTCLKFASWGRHSGETGVCRCEASCRVQRLRMLHAHGVISKGVKSWATIVKQAYMSSNGASFSKQSRQARQNCEALHSKF